MIIQPWIAIPTFIVGNLFIMFRKFYLKTSRSVKRLEGVTRSPIFNHLASSLDGLATLRAFNANSKMVEEFDALQNIHSSVFFATFSTIRWFTLQMDLITAVYLLYCVLSFLYMPLGNRILVLKSLEIKNMTIMTYSL